MNRRKILVIVFLSLFLFILSACGEKNDSAITDFSEHFTAADTLASYTKNAGATTRSENKDGNWISIADFHIGITYVITQQIIFSEGYEVLNIRIRNIQISQPTNGEISFDGAFLYMSNQSKWTTPDNGEIYFSSDQLVENNLSMQEIQMQFSNALGIISVENYTVITGTQSEADEYFSTFAADNQLNSENLQTSISFRLEITAYGNGKTEKCYKDITFKLFPGDFLSESYNWNNPYNFNNSGVFVQ